MSILATQNIPSPGFFGPASIFAAVLVSVLAYAVRRSPSPQNEGLSILAPPACLLMAAYSSLAAFRPDVQDYIETFIYLAAAFGFSIHNFHFQHTFHWIHGSICSFLAGIPVAFFGSMLAIQGALTDIAALPLICVAETLFIVGWSVTLYALITRRRQRHTDPESQG